MDSDPVYPRFETQMVGILVDAGEDFQERVLHRFFRIRRVTHNTQAGNVQSLCELFVQGQLRVSLSTSATINQLYCRFVHLYI